MGVQFIFIPKFYPHFPPLYSLTPAIKCFLIFHRIFEVPTDTIVIELLGGVPKPKMYGPTAAIENVVDRKRQLYTIFCP